MDWYVPGCRWDEKVPKADIDTTRAGDKLKAIHLVAKHGGKCRPSDYEINSACRTLLRMIPDYTVDFVWIMSVNNSYRSDSTPGRSLTATSKANEFVTRSL